MANALRLALTGLDERVASGLPQRGKALHTERALHTHAVQFYESEEFFFETVGHFLLSGLEANARVVAVVTRAHREGLLTRLDASSIHEALATGQLTMLDAREMLSKFMVGEMPDPMLFRAWIADVVETVAGGGSHSKDSDETAGSGDVIGVFGEMVDVLWKEGNSSAAIRLEELWNAAQNEHPFSLLCAYPMENFQREGDSAGFEHVCGNHRTVVPTEKFDRRGEGDASLRQICLLQQRAKVLESEIRRRTGLEGELRHALEARRRAEEELRSLVEREREARALAEASDGFKELFIGILGHDLRNPLNTILMTSRLMTMRNELPPESRKRLERVVLSGERMQRMIAQILDLTGARLAGGIAITRVKENLVPLVTTIVDEVRLGSPGRAIQLRAEGPCVADVDGDRIEQVVSNLLGNAVKHGDPSKPIQVAVTAGETTVSVSVHNHGPPIDPSFIPLLFDPFKRCKSSYERSDGLGLGLYISERIVAAHGGRIEVQSSHETGTRFEAVLPREARSPR